MEAWSFTTLVSTNILARLFFQKEMPWGNPESIKQHGLLGTDNYSISWAGWQSPPPNLIILGLGVGILSGALAKGLSAQLAPMAAKGIISAASALVVPLIMGWVLPS